jgi:hypothetical protein
MSQARITRDRVIGVLSRGALIAVGLTGLAVVVANVGRAPAASARISCGVENWALKTMTDPQRGLVRLRPKATTIAAINALPMPHPTPTSRDNAYERQVWRVRAQVVEYKAEEDGDINIVLFDQGAYLIAEQPAATCLTGARARRTMIAARSLFETRCGAATSSWRDLGAVVSIAGVGFWDFAHRQRGHARNYAELHPVTSLRIIAGCQ